jgi:aspartyl protease family protein
MIGLHLDEIALADGYRALGRCGISVAPLWRMLALHQKRNEWVSATLLSTILIDDDPRDSDFWWWRGEALANAGHPWPALADYRQSLANASGAQPGGFAVARFGDPAAATGERCEGARAWRFYTHVLGGEMTQEARDGYAALVRAGTCAPDDGQGGARILIDTMSGTGPVPVTIGAATGSFQLDSAAGTSVVSRAFAARAGLAPRSGDHVTTLHGGALVSGPPSIAPSIAAAGASAANVDVLISDQLPPGEDGVLGVSFLWHFDVATEGAVVVLTPPRPGK